MRRIQANEAVTSAVVQSDSLALDAMIRDPLWVLQQLLHPTSHRPSKVNQIVSDGKIHQPIYCLHLGIQSTVPSNEPPVSVTLPPNTLVAQQVVVANSKHHFQIQDGRNSD